MKKCTEVRHAGKSGSETDKKIRDQLTTWFWLALRGAFVLVFALFALAFLVKGGFALWGLCFSTKGEIAQTTGTGGTLPPMTINSNNTFGGGDGGEQRSKHRHDELAAAAPTSVPAPAVEPTQWGLHVFNRSGKPVPVLVQGALVQTIRSGREAS